jgi:hypothetical protein
MFSFKCRKRFRTKVAIPITKFKNFLDDLEIVFVTIVFGRGGPRRAARVLVLRLVPAARGIENSHRKRAAAEGRSGPGRP